jgi:hypothetical protein
MLKNFATVVTKWEISDSWVDWFLHCYANKLTTKWTTEIDCKRHLANSQRKYKLYFNLLHSKMREYGVDERNTYNMDEKGFFVGINSHTKRIVSKTIWESKERTTALRDGNRAWVTLLACVCASEEALPPALIYQDTSGIQLTWVDNLVAKQHQVFISHSATGWSNNNLGLAWLQQVFDCYTAAKARRQWRLLILDGHGSHLTPEFLEYCNSWPELRKIFNAAVADKARIKRLSQSLHLLQVNNKLLCTQNKELQHKLNVIKKRPTQQTILTTQDGNDWHGGTVFYSPRKLASERACKAAELNEAAQLQLKKNPPQ